MSGERYFQVVRGIFKLLNFFSINQTTQTKFENSKKFTPNFTFIIAKP